MTVEILGGTQALARTETLHVRLDDAEATVRAPALLGAILLKARAIRSSHRDQGRDDLVVLGGIGRTLLPGLDEKRHWRR